jgi:hypothetical protein
MPVRFEKNFYSLDPLQILDRTRVIRSECRQEERTEEEDRSQTLDPSVGPDHCWIKENLYAL